MIIWQTHVELTLMMAATQWFVFLLHTTWHCKNWWRLGFHHFFSIRICFRNPFPIRWSSTQCVFYGFFHSLSSIHSIRLCHAFSQHDTGKRLSMHWHQRQTLAIKHWTGLLRKFHCIVFLFCHFGSVLSCCILLWVTCFDQRCQRLARRGNSTWHVQWMNVFDGVQDGEAEKKAWTSRNFQRCEVLAFWLCFETGQGWRRGTRVVCGWLRPLRGCTWLKSVSGNCHSAWNWQVITVTVCWQSPIVRHCRKHGRSQKALGGWGLWKRGEKNCGLMFGHQSRCSESDCIDALLSWFSAEIFHSCRVVFFCLSRYLAFTIQIP